MQLFLDTANVKEIEEISSLGVISGLTTNPSLLAKERVEIEQVIDDILALVNGPISLEVLSERADDMVIEARKLAGIHKNIVVKIPMTVEGLKAVKVLASEGIATNVTLIFSANQALLAALAGATYVSPFAGRLDDVGQDGMALVEEIVEIFELHGIGTKVIAASIRHPQHVTQAAQAGAHIATVPAGVVRQMVGHPLTDKGIERFMADWQAAQKSLSGQA